MRTFAYLATACFVAAALGVSSAFAAVPTQKKAAPGKVLNRQGVLTGGLAGTGFSLVDLKFNKLSDKERVILDIGDLNGGPVRGLPAYFHAELQENPRRLVLDLSQTPTSMIDDHQMMERFKGSKSVANASLVMDPTDKTLSLILDFKKDVKAQVFQVSGKVGTSKIVIDLL